MKTRVLHRLCQLAALGALGLWMMPHGALAQANPNPQVAFPPAPNAASLGEYGAIPVSNYTGLANITVPLHSIATKSNRVDVSLSYRASGVRVEEEASWVGLGWSLNAGGVVTRSLQGLDDLVTNPSGIGGYAISGPLPPWDANNNYNPTGRSFTADRDYFLDVCANYRDTQPDLFYYNFGQHSGKFVLEKSSTLGQFTVRLIDNADNSSIVYKTLAATGKTGWAIVTADGYTYSFGDYETTTVTSVGNGVLIQPYTSSWYLTEIVAPDGERVAFTYDTNYTTSQEARSFTNGVYFDRRVVQTNGGCGTGITRTGAMSGYPTTPSRTVSQTTGVILKSIAYANGTINFSHADRDDTQGNYTFNKAQRLTGFTVSNSAPAGDQVVKVVSLRQSYFNAGASSPTKNMRLRLDAVGQSNQGQAIPDYVFTYYAGTLPSKESYNKDFLGYYNGANNDALQTDIPTLTVPLISNPAATTTLLGPSANRNPNAQFAQTSSLQQITYPTGGQTLFEYESHAYRDASNALQTGCGLRIARITSTDDITGNNSVKKYAYTLPNSTISSGRKLSPDNYLHLGYESETYSCLGSSGQSDYYFYFAIRSSSSTMALSNSAQGQSYGYDLVTVLEGENGENGKTAYSYTNVEDQLPVASFNTTIPNKVNVANGNLLLETVYKKNKTTNGFDKAVETENNYTTGTLAGGDLRLIKGCVVSRDLFCGADSYSPDVLYYGVKYYDVQSYWTRLNSTIKRVYNQNNPALFTQTSTTYQYGNPAHRQVTMTAQTLPTGDVLREYHTYPSDYTTLTSGPVFDMANSLHVLNSPVESYTTVAHSSAEQLTGGKFITYTYAKGGNALVHPARIDQLRLSSPAAFSGFTPSTPALQKDPRYAPVQYLGYNQATGNIDFSRKADDAVESYQWDYQYQQPVASFKNADRTVVSSLPGYIGNEASFIGFESGQAVDANPQEDYWLNTGTGDSRNYLTATAHTGLYAWRVGPVPAWSYNYGPTRVIAPSRQATQYKLSAWVNTEAGFRADGGQLILSVSDQNDNQVNTTSSYVPVSFGDTQGKWKYVEAIIDLNAVRQEAGATASARYRVVGYVCNTGGPNGNVAGFRLDDLRLHPVDAQAITYTYDAGTHLPTSVSDANSRPVYYEYDALQRLIIMKDDEGNIVKHFEYHYKRP